ncbi:MAG: ABC transporter permease subunit [Candidatus Borkfalkiaceae bacterium]|nr:ABC transporter permease subunit [Christensenellaceae bacterium]
MTERDLSKREKRTKRRGLDSRDVQLFCMAGLSVLFLAVFAYTPMAGIALAFKNGNYKINLFEALLEPGWTLENFRKLFGDEVFWTTFLNTLTINVLMLVFNFPMPILFAMLLNEVRCSRLKKGIQTICNFPQFISWVIYGGIILALTDANTGIVNPILEFLHLSSPEDPVDLNLAQYFYPKIIFATIVKGVGWGSIVYLAAISNIDPALYEAAMIDGANRWKRAVRITLPMIKPTIVIFLLLNLSGLLGNNFEQFYVFQTTQNLSTTRVLATYVYSLGFTLRQYSTATALSLFEGVISVVLLLSSNFASKKLTGEGIF